MSATKKILAFDLGAESGRGLVASFDGERIQLEVVHRFANGGVQTLDTLHWDVLRLYSEMLLTLRKAAAEHGPLASIGVDTWGVDFALLGRDGSLLGNPRHYRDPHTESIMEQTFARMPATGDLSPDRHPVHAFQHALPAAGPGARPARRSWSWPRTCCSFPICSITGSPGSRSTNTPTPAPAR